LRQQQGPRLLLQHTKANSWTALVLLLSGLAFLLQRSAGPVCACWQQQMRQHATAAAGLPAALCSTEHSQVEAASSRQQLHVERRLTPARQAPDPQ
jgi:hypothetical protein